MNSVVISEYIQNHQRILGCVQSDGVLFASQEHISRSINESIFCVSGLNKRTEYINELLRLS